MIHSTSVNKAIKLLEAEIADLLTQVDYLKNALRLLKRDDTADTNSQIAKERKTRKRKARKKEPEVVDIDRECLKCHVVKPLAEFRPSRRGWRRMCRSCESALSADKESMG